MSFTVMTFFLFLFFSLTLQRQSPSVSQLSQAEQLKSAAFRPALSVGKRSCFHFLDCWMRNKFWQFCFLCGYQILLLLNPEMNE